MRAGWILLKIRHKQYGVNVDEVGADSIRPFNPAGRRRYAGAIEGIKTGRCGHRPLRSRPGGHKGRPYRLFSRIKPPRPGVRRVRGLFSLQRG